MINIGEEVFLYVRDRLVPWTKGLVAAVITGVSSAVGAMIVDPTSFNLSDPAAFERVKSVAVAAGVIGALAYLKQSPLP